MGILHLRYIPDRIITAFSPPGKKVHFNRLPMGMGLSPAAMQRAMDLLLQGLEFVKKYIDDILCFSDSEDEHFEHWRQIFTRLLAAGLKLKLKKCSFFQTKMDFLGHTISLEGIEMQDDKIDAIKKFPKPTTLKRLQSFLGYMNFYRKFMKDFGAIARPLYNLLKKETVGQFGKDWGEEHDQAFEKLKELAITAPVRAYPDFTKPFILTTDASGIGLGAILSQLDDKGEEHPIAFASRCLRDVELRYSNTDRELLATVFGVRHFHPFLYGRKFTICTDHIALKLLHER
jgi:RNase H-like domain found in reverse transcriptase/Reverse transcriptase (RNA-dependent DNA polymerase)